MINFGSAGQFVGRDGKRLTFKYDATGAFIARFTGKRGAA